MQQALWYLGMLIIGGMGSTLGPVLGVVFIRGLQEIMLVLAPMLSQALPAIGGGSFSIAGQLLTGTLMILFLILEPRGLTHRWEMFKVQYRRWPFPY